MRSGGDWTVLFAFIVFFQIAVKVNSSSNTTIPNQPNIIHATKLSTLNSTEENSLYLPKGSQNSTNLTNSSENAELTKMPLPKKEEPLKEPRTEEEGQNGKLSSSDSFVEEECDPSNRCEDEKKKFTACLRVPGTDSLALSLLIENRGTDSLNIDISAPNFVNLEQSKVELKSKEHKEVRVSLYKDSNNTKILLKSLESHCVLTLPNTIAIEPSRTFFSNLRTSFLTIIIPPIILTLIILTYLCIKFRKTNSGTEKLEELLPVSTGGKEEFCKEDPENWDDNDWGDGWDEEAPLTPSKPFSKPLYKGLASRKINKDGWKD